jgi:hypothetical protein
LKKMRLSTIDCPISLGRWNMIVPTARLRIRDGEERTVSVRTTYEKTSP